MKSFESKDHSPSSTHGQGNGSKIAFTPTCNYLGISGQLTWADVEIISTILVAVDDFKLAAQSHQSQQTDKAQYRAANDNVYEARKADNLVSGERFSAALDALCAEGYTRHDALSQVARSYGKGIKEIEILIKYFNRQSKDEIRAERQAQTSVLMHAGKSAFEIGQALGVSKSEAHRIMQSVQGTDGV